MIWWWRDGTLLMCIVIDGFIADFLWWMEDVFFDCRLHDCSLQILGFLIVGLLIVDVLNWIEYMNDEYMNT